MQRVAVEVQAPDSTPVPSNNPRKLILRVIEEDAQCGNAAPGAGQGATPISSIPARPSSRDHLDRLLVVTGARAVDCVGTPELHRPTSARCGATFTAATPLAAGSATAASIFYVVYAFVATRRCG